MGANRHNWLHGRKASVTYHLTPCVYRNPLKVREPAKKTKAVGSCRMGAAASHNFEMSHPNMTTLHHFSLTYASSHYLFLSDMAHLICHCCLARYPSTHPMALTAYGEWIKDLHASRRCTMRLVAIAGRGPHYHFPYT